MSNRLKVTELDFDSIKLNLKNFLKQQSEFQDYDFEGSGMSVLLDILAYNTHYNAYYLNMIANESFLDSSILRSSVVSHAKKYGYTPKSRVAPRAVVNVSVDGTSFLGSTLTLPKNFIFRSETVDRISYDFVTLEEKTALKDNNVFTFSNVEIYQGSPATFTYNYDQSTNPKQIFEIPDSNVDTSTLKVLVQKSSSNTYITVYKKAQDVLEVTSNTEVYYIQESQKGKYEVYFGDGVVGRKLLDGNIVTFQYLITEGSAANRANNFIVSDTISNLSDISVVSVSSAAGGAEKESIDEIKYAAPLQFLSQNRAVTKNDYIRLIMEKYDGFDAVNVWGGEENKPPVFGKVFVSAKPKLGYELTNTEKELIKEEILKPISILTVSPEIVDVDYNYLKVDSTVYYNPTLTTLSESDIRTSVANSISNFCNQELNKFNSYFKSSSLLNKVDNLNQSIISNELDLLVGKKFRPDLINTRSYVLDFGFPLKKGEKENNLYSFPKFRMFDETGTLQECFFEEVPSSYGGVESIIVTNPGYGYTLPPTVLIEGDGEGAVATASILNGRVDKITIVNPGVGYTSAKITLVKNPDNNSTTFLDATGEAVTEGRYGKIRIAYYASSPVSNQNIKYILNRNVNEGNTGTIDYVDGKIYIDNFNPIAVNNDLERIILYIRPKSNVIRSQFNKMLVLDSTDPTSISVKVVRN